MPTGYTSDVKDGKVTSLRDFALACARAFGACVTLRDEPSDAPIPDEFKPETKYHDDAILKAQRDLDEIAELDAAECGRRAKADYEAELASWREYEARQDEDRNRYLSMREKVKAWEVPEELSPLKKFMLEQLTESIRFDCGGEDRTNPYFDARTPKRLTGAEWRTSRLDAASKSLAYSTQQRDAEIRRVAERNKWIATLRASLKGPR